MIASAGQERKCRECGDVLPISEFYVKERKAGKVRYFARCKPCVRKAAIPRSRRQTMQAAAASGREYKSHDQRRQERSEREKRLSVERKKRKREKDRRSSDPWNMSLKNAELLARSRRQSALRRLDPWTRKLDSLETSIRLRKSESFGPKRKRQRRDSFETAFRFLVASAKAHVKRQRQDEWTRKLVSVAHNQRVRIKRNESERSKPKVALRTATVQMCFEWAETDSRQRGT